MPQRDEASVDMASPAPDFDVREMARTAHGSHRETLDLDAYSAQPLSAETVAALAYLGRLERATMSHLRGVLVTATHKDARVTAFLTTWAFEKFWIADALEQVVLTVSGVDPKPEKMSTKGEHTIWESVVGNIVGVPMIGVHMTQGTVDEWITQAMYRRVVELEPHPELTRMIDSFLAIKARQLVFFEAQARYRLLDSSASRRMSRRTLKRTPIPIGARSEDKSDTRAVLSRLLGDDAALVAELDARIDSLPGLESLALVRKNTQW